LAVNDVFLGTKCLLWLLHVASGIGMFLYVKALTKSDMSAFFAAVFYVFSFQHLGAIVVLGASPVGVIFLLLPVQFWIYELLYQSQLSSVKAGAATAFVLSLALFTHVQYGVLVTLSFVLCAVIRLRMDSVHRKDRLFVGRQVKYLVVSLLLFFLYAAWFLIPMCLETRVLTVSNDPVALAVFEGLSRASVRAVLNVFLWSRRHMDWEFLYIGLVPLGVALAGLFFHGRQRDTIHRSYLCLFAIGFAYLFVSPRFVNVWLFFACVMSGYGVLALGRLVGSRLPRAREGFFPALIVLLFVDLGATLVQRPFEPLDNSGIRALQEQLSRQGDTGRILNLYGTRAALWRSLDVVDTNASSPFGGIPQASTKTHFYMASIASRAALEILDDGTGLSDTTRDALRLLNVEYVAVPATEETFDVVRAHPAWFSRRIEVSQGQGFSLDGECWEPLRLKHEDRSVDFGPVDAMIRAMQLGEHRPIAERILLHDSYVEDELALPDREPTSDHEPFFSVADVRETHSTVQMDYESSADGYVHLAYSYFPFNKAKIDGEPTAFYRSAWSFAVVPIPKGHHRLTIEAGVSRLRLALLGISLTALFTSVLALCMGHISSGPFRSRPDASASEGGLRSTPQHLS
jgi:hypothetical protein